MSQPKQIDNAQLEHTTGGLKWQGRRQSYNVEDRRPGAPSPLRQKLNTLVTNWSNGYWY